MPQLITIYWRDIPSQVIAKQGRKSAKVKLSERFQEAIDKAAMRAGRQGSDQYLEFEKLVIKELGLDRHPQLRELYFGNYRRLVYLAQLPNPDLERQAQEAAERLGLAYEQRLTGLDGFAANLSALNLQETACLS